jgi:hypothetical protein
VKSLWFSSYEPYNKGWLGKEEISTSKKKETSEVCKEVKKPEWVNSGLVIFHSEEI